MRLHSVENNAYTTVDTEIADTDTEFIVVPSVLDALAVPFLVDVGQEIIRVTAVALDTPDVGQTTWTVTREINGAAGNYEKGVPITLRYYAEHVSELQVALRWLERLLVDLLGGSDGVICRESITQLSVSETTGLTVQVAPGAAIISGEIVALLAAKNVTLNLPEDGTRTDLIQINNRGEISVLEDEDTTPSADNIALATVSIAFNTVDIVQDDITDKRVLL